MSFINKTFLNSDWNHRRFNLGKEEKNRSDPGKYTIKYIGKNGEYKTKNVELEKQVPVKHKVNSNLKIKNQELKPYLMGKNLSGTGIINEGTLKIEINNINIKLPLKLMIFGDISVDWIFNDCNEIVFDMISDQFEGKMVGVLRGDYIFIDLLENKYGTEHQLKNTFLPYSIKYYG